MARPLFRINIVAVPAKNQAGHGTIFKAVKYCPLDPGCPVYLSGWQLYTARELLSIMECPGRPETGLEFICAQGSRPILQYPDEDHDMKPSCSMFSRFFRIRRASMPATLIFCLSFLAALLITGCAAVRGLHGPREPQPVGLEIGDVVDTAQGTVISMDELVSRLLGASVVYIGETHTSSEDHKAQLRLLRRLQEKGQCTILAMEMFPREAQPVLDRYVKGEMSEQEFLKEVKWDKVWGFPYHLYKGLIDFAREKKLRILALNAPGDVVSKIARHGLSSLSPADRGRVARDFHLDDPKNRARIRKEYEIHLKDSIKDFESFFEAQLAWEETMAETIAGQLKETGAKCRIVVIIGEGHITDGLGVPYLAKMRTPHEYVTVAPIPINYPFSSFDPDLAQFVLITDKSEPFHRPRLGIRIASTGSGRGVEVVDVFPGTPAARANIRKGDIVIQVDRSPVKSPEELVRAIAAGGPEYKIMIERGKKRLTIEATIPR